MSDRRLLVLAVIVLVSMLVLAVFGGRTTTTAIRVEVTKDGVPMQGIPVMLTRAIHGDSSCDGRLEGAMTGADGRSIFVRHVDGPRRDGLYRRSDDIALCVHSGDSFVSVWGRTHVGAQDWVLVSCDFGVPADPSCVTWYKSSFGRYLSLLAFFGALALLFRMAWYQGTEMHVAAWVGAVLLISVPLSPRLLDAFSVVLVLWLGYLHVRMRKRPDDPEGIPGPMRNA